MKNHKRQATVEYSVANGSHSTAKRPKFDTSHPMTCSMNSCYTEDAFRRTITECWRSKGTVNHDSSGAYLMADPFQCCVLPNFVSSPVTQPSAQTAAVSQQLESHLVGGAMGVTRETFLDKLKNELLRLKFYEKNNDLYQFHQSDDLKKFNSPCISALRSLLRDECLPWLRSVTGIELSDIIDITCSKYEYTDVLLCHDDELEGRRIAFILYLASDLTTEDGGSLDLYSVDGNGQPSAIVKSLQPVWNNFVFFDVNAVSFHQVSEVTTPSKTRLSVNGWFHGPLITRPTPYKEVVRPLHPPIPMELESLSEWINPIYLDVGVQSQIQSQFEDESQIELPDFVLEEKYEQLHEEMCANNNWTVCGAPNKRHIHTTVSDDLLLLSKTFCEMLQSEPFCLLLSHLTGLDLAENVIRDTVDQGEGVSDDLAHSSSSCRGNSSSQPELKSDNTNTHAEKEGQNTVSNDSPSHGGQKNPVAMCRCDVYRWEHGDYSLAGDEGDPGMGRFSLEALLHFCPQGWSPDCGGVVSYIAKDADEELLSIVPRPNALSLVYRDQDSLCFTKYVNHRVSCHGDSNSSNSLYSINATYVENSIDK